MHHSKATKKIFEVLISLAKDNIGAEEIIKSVLINCGVETQSIIEQDIDGRKALAIYCRSLKEAEGLQTKLKKFAVLNVNVTILYQDDWLTRWKKDWKPFALTASIDVVPVWCRTGYQEGHRTFILLDTVSSFGTGLHETTQFMAQFIEDLDGKFERFLDVGTGTGILTLMALKNGAKDVCAIDLDDMCINASRANLKANGYQLADRVIHKNLLEFKPSVPFEFVCANLVTHDLISMKRKIFSFVKPGGWLAVSGISLENLPRLRQAFATLSLRCIKVKKGESWSAVLFKRKQAR